MTKQKGRTTSKTIINDDDELPSILADISLTDNDGGTANMINASTNSTNNGIDGSGSVDGCGSVNHGIPIKLERQSPTPSTCRNESSQSTPTATTFNYDLKISSPISWAVESIKTEKSSPNSSTAAIIKPASIDVTTTPTAIDPAPQILAANIPSSNTVATTTTTTTTSKTTTSSVHAAKRSKRALQTQLQQSVNSTSPITSINLRNKTLKVIQNQLKRDLTTTVNTTETISSLTSDEATISRITTATTTTTSSSTSESAAAAAAAAVAANNDKKYRIMFQNHRIRKESLEHGDDMIYNPDIEKPWICKNCNRNYKWKNSLKCHLKNECGLPPRYFCNKMCGYRTNVHSNLKRHLNTKCKTKDDDVKNQ